MAGILYVCATPIGNMEDITLRVLRILKEVDFIAAEDTRQTQKILNHYDINTRTTSYHEHNKIAKGPIIIDRLLAGESCAIVTDAGMPGISDPGEDLIKLCYDNNIAVTVCPGATAAVTALVLSGLQSKRYCFDAFLPSDKKEKMNILNILKEETRTIILYEAPHRLCETLEVLYNSLGDRNAAVIRELTKKYETVQKGSLSELLQYYNENQPRGEIAIVIEGVDINDKIIAQQVQWNEMDLSEHMQIYLQQGISEKDAMKKVAKDRGLPKRDIYNKIKK